jgi:uncharacterized protein YycO
MKSSRLLRAVFAVSCVVFGVYSWFKIFRSPETKPQDGEPDGEIDPDLPFARAGDILLFNRAQGLNRLITWFTHSHFYHVGIALGENRVVEARPRGVVIRDLTGPDGDKRFQIIPAANVGGSETAERAMNWALSRVGDGYDPFNVLSLVCDRVFTHINWNASLPRHWTCGEFVATAYENAGAPLFEKSAASVAPVDFQQFLPSQSQPRS